MLWDAFISTLICQFEGIVSNSIFPETVPAVCMDYRMVDTSFLTNMSVGREKIWGQGTTMLYRLKVLTFQSVLGH